MTSLLGNRSIADETFTPYDDRRIARSAFSRPSMRGPGIFRELGQRYDNRHQRWGHSRGASSSRNSVSDFRLEKTEGLFGHGKSDDAARRSDTGTGCRRSDLYGASVAFAVAVGSFTRLSALLLVLYTLGTAVIGHRYWTMTGADRVDSMDGSYKNLSIMGGFLLLYITGAGKYSIDVLWSIPAP